MYIIDHKYPARILFLRVFAFAMGLLSAQSLLAATYYVDPAGKDTNDGTTPAAAWKSLAKIAQTTFKAGDKLLLKANGVWSGQLSPRGSGSSEASIAISSYGDGAKPIINGGGLAEGAIKLLNQEYWEISDLEVTNHAQSTGQYVGIKIRNNTGGELRHIVVRNCVVHSVNGYASGFYGANAGIAVVADMNNSTWREVLIENNEVYNVDRVGIFVGPTWQVGGSPDWMKEPKSKNITIQNNTIWNLGGDGILNFVTEHVLIQHNLVYETGLRSYSEAVGPKNPTGYSNAASAAIWNVISDYTVMQFNEVYRCMAGLDGEAFDVDMGTNHTIIQYNYSHDNLGGFLLLCESGSAEVDINDVKVRFNISQADGLTKGPLHVGQYGFPPGPDKTHINNNTIYVPASAQNGVKMWRPYGMKTIVGEAYIYNNIFYILGNVTYPGFENAKFDYNVFYGRHPEGEPDDPHKLTADPLLVRPGSATFGLDSVDGYKLQAGSPALASGTNTGGEFLGTRDYWNNPVSPTANPNRGAYNGPGETPVAPNWALDSKVTASSSREDNFWSKTRLVDGQRLSFVNSNGFSSTFGNTSGQPEWIEIDMGAQRQVSSVTLYPTTLHARIGQGFPKAFEIQTWDGNGWKTQITRANFANPGASPQTFTFKQAATTGKIRIHCTQLDRPGSNYMLQLAEIEITP